jgi:creatinine amidohydrolase
VDATPSLPLELEQMTHCEAEAILGPETVVFVPLGSCEPHGPHLPLGNDVSIARAWCSGLAASLRERGRRAVLAPALPYGISHLTEGWAGRLTLQPGTLWALLDDLVCALDQEGVRRVVLASAHLEPQHMEVVRGVALDHAAAEVGEARVVVLETASVLPPNATPAQFHAGLEETSLALALGPQHVRSECAADLPAVVPDPEKIAEGQLAAGARRAYCGEPASATAEQGVQLLETLTQNSLAELASVWPDLSP